MADPKNAKSSSTKDTSPKVAGASADDATHLSDAVASESSKNPNIRNDLGLSSVGADLHPDAPTTTVDGMLALEAGGDHAAAAPQPTPAEVVLYPSTGGLPDTGPNSKYVVGNRRGPELFNREGQRVNRDGQPIDGFGDRILAKGEDEVLKEGDVEPKRELPKRIKEEQEAGRRALKRA